MDTKQILERLDINLDHIQDEKIKIAFYELYNLIEQLTASNRELQQRFQSIHDELNRLKGEQAKPAVKPNTTLRPKSDHSSETERQKEDKKNVVDRQPKSDRIKIDRHVNCLVDQNSLPKDAEFKGYTTIIVQDLKIETDNIEFRRETYYSPSEKKTYLGELPAGYEGQFGPTIKAQVIILKNACDMSESKILAWLQSHNIEVSAGTISNIAVKDKDVFHQEKADIFAAGLASTPPQQIDDTAARFKGQNYHTHVIGNPLFTAYFTTPHKNRLTVLEILNGGQKLNFCLNDKAFDLLSQLNVAQKHILKLRPDQSDQLLSKTAMEYLISDRLPAISDRVKNHILEAAGIAAYHQRTDWPVVKALLADDAPQFKLLTELLALCWIHEGRHYKKLEPVVPDYVLILADFRRRFWDYYHQLLDYKQAPSTEKAEQLAVTFDHLFTTQTGYQHLDERIAKTLQKKDQLLLVLKYPEIPLHNNDMELAARAQARKRDVSFHTMSIEGTQAKDSFMTIIQTCKKLGVNSFDYIKDRISKKYNMPALSQLIQIKSTQNTCVENAL